ncbi:MAG TPA: YbhN family protein [Acidimicrobiales bacterium]|nr:YbhN family protein [Acidimicrobiales bacterium]
MSQPPDQLGPRAEEGRSAEPPPDTSGAPGRRRRWRRWLAPLRWILALALLATAGWQLASRRRQLGDAVALFGHLRWWAVGLACGAEVASLLSFAAEQRRLLAAGRVSIGLRSMARIVVAGNALGTSLPGGVAWSAGWEWNQLRRRGADRPTVIWVLLAAGTLSSFALFVVIAVGIFVAGDEGPLASTRPEVAGLAAIPVLVGGVSLLVHRVTFVGRLLGRPGSWLTRRFPSTRVAVRLYRSLTAIRPRNSQWAAAGGLALGNWLFNGACMVCAMSALSVRVPWRGVLVSYGFSQVAASFPITPGGLGVVEGSLAALLVAYGMATDQALASVALYRLVSFWGAIAVGWVVWATVVLSERRGDTHDLTSAL